ncbi:MAG: hypothetical protein OYM47_20095 [Gemmatimonadota bacterium]|nr:hypothetical protein [Gemmatimonadota bacterium]
MQERLQEIFAHGDGTEKRPFPIHCHEEMLQVLQNTAKALQTVHLLKHREVSRWIDQAEVYVVQWIPETSRYMWTIKSYYFDISPMGLLRRAQHRTLSIYRYDLAEVEARVKEMAKELKMNKPGVGPGI